MPLCQFHAHRLAQVVNLALVDGQVRVAGDTKLRKAADNAAWKQVLKVSAYGRRQQHERLLARSQFGRQRNHPRQHARHFQDRDRRRPPEGVLAFQLHDEVQRLVQHLWERMRWVEADGRQQRLHFTLHVVAQPGALISGALRMIDDHDVLFCQRRHDRVVIKLVLLGD